MSVICASFLFIKYSLGTSDVPSPVLNARMTWMSETVPTRGKFPVHRSPGVQLPGTGISGERQENHANPVTTAMGLKLATKSEATKQNEGAGTGVDFSFPSSASGVTTMKFFL